MLVLLLVSPHLWHLTRATHQVQTVEWPVTPGTWLKICWGNPLFQRLLIAMWPCHWSQRLLASLATNRGRSRPCQRWRMSLGVYQLISCRRVNLVSFVVLVKLQAGDIKEVFLLVYLALTLSQPFYFWPQQQSSENKTHQYYSTSIFIKLLFFFLQLPNCFKLQIFKNSGQGQWKCLL